MLQASFEVWTRILMSDLQSNYFVFTAQVS